MKNIILIGVCYVTLITALAKNSEAIPFNWSSNGKGQENCMAQKAEGNDIDSQRVPGYQRSAKTGLQTSTKTTPLEIMVNYKPNCLIFWTTNWCADCRKQRVVINQLRLEGYTVYTLNLDKNKELAEEMEVDSVPTMIIHEDSEETERFEGLTSARKIRKHLKRNKIRDKDD